ncbi:MAG: nitroreductase family protein [Deltaproteobacteria bacterium]|nr:nitroreductase family protein [Deltaproteobacteria bacterium]
MMELKEVIGRRRSIRIFAPYRPVERAKVQKMLEAARRASCAGNVMNIRAVVIWREKASKDLIDSIKLPLSYQQMQTAPVFIFWYDECMAYKGEHWVESVTELVESRRLGADLEGTRKEIETMLAPAFLSMDPLQTGSSPGAIMDCGQAIAQATLIAYEEGLGSCLLGGPVLGRVGKRLKIPETGIPLCLQAVGYPAESWEAGGQTNKPELGELFYEMECGKPFESDPAVVEELKAAKLIQRPPPLPWREAELKYLIKAVDLETRLVRLDSLAPEEDEEPA